MSASLPNALGGAPRERGASLTLRPGKQTAPTPQLHDHNYPCNPGLPLGCNHDRGSKERSPVRMPRPARSRRQARHEGRSPAQSCTPDICFPKMGHIVRMTQPQLVAAAGSRATNPEFSQDLGCSNRATMRLPRQRTSEAPLRAVSGNL